MQPSLPLLKLQFACSAFQENCIVRWSPGFSRLVAQFRRLKAELQQAAGNFAVLLLGIPCRLYNRHLFTHN